MSSLRDSEGNSFGGWRPRIGFGKKRRTILGYRLSSLTGLFVLAGVMLLRCPGAWALDPALDVSQYAHTAWKIRDGFTKGLISSIAQTPDGYLWLGTEFGLYRFDGVRAVPWQPPTGQQLPDTVIRSLLATSDGTLWIGTLKGLASWKDGKLSVYKELVGQIIAVILRDREGTVWAGTYGAPTGMLCAIHDGSVHCSGNDGSLGSGVKSLYEDRKGNLWAAESNGVWRWKPGRQFYPFQGGNHADNVDNALAEDDEGVLLIGMRDGLKRLLDGRIEAYPLSRAVRQFGKATLLPDRDGGLWIGTSNGLVHVHQGRTDAFAAPDGLSGDLITGAPFEDGEGNIWVPTSDGLDRFRDYAVATMGVNQGLSSAHVTSVLADNDRSVWISTSEGLNRRKDGQVAAFAKRDWKLNGLAPHALFQDAHGRIWISTDRGAGYLENDRFILSGVRDRNVLSFAEDSGGNLWMNDAEQGLIRLSAQREIEHIPWSKLRQNDVADTMAADPLRGGLWLGFFRGGVAYYKDGQVRAFYAAADGLGEGRVINLRLEPEGTLWVATQGGLSRLRNGRIATLSSKNGLPCDTVHLSVEDDDHAFWLYTACGLVRIAKPELDAWIAASENDKNTKLTIQTTLFDSSDGVVVRGSVGSVGPIATKSASGRLWFATLEGLSILDPRHLPFNKLPPPVHIEQITADRKTYDTTPDAGGRVPLPARIRDLQIDYTALSLVTPEKIRFRYKLEGRDSDWQDAGNRRQAFYTDLPPRNYRFRVKACNNSGVWNETGAFLDFSVAPAYYQTWWFRLSLVGAFLVLLWAAYQLRLQQLAYEYDIRVEERVGERTRIARELHDSLLQGFQGMMFRLQAVRDLLPKRPSEAAEALDIAMERGDQAIAEGRDTVSALREPIFSDKDIAAALTSLGEELAAQCGNGSGPCVRVLVEGKQRELNPELRDEIYRIGREAMRNAFRHAKAQKIETEITYGESEFSLNVRDDGIGLIPAVADLGARAGHWGLPGMRERAKSFGGKLEVWSEGGAGTEVELTVPAAVAYGVSGAGWGARRRFWSLRKKIGVTDGKHT